MRLVRAILSSRRGLVLTALAVAYVIWESWLSLHAPAKVIGPFAGKSEKVNVLVTLPFPPDRFHIQVFQKYGRR